MRQWYLVYDRYSRMKNKSKLERGEGEGGWGLILYYNPFGQVV